MSFQQSYYRDIVNKWVTDFLQDKTNEELLRNIFSRAYYTMFLHCREVHTVDLEMENFNFSKLDESHARVIKMIKNQGIQTLVYQYKKYRERADYNIDLLKMPVYIKIGGKPQSMENLGKLLEEIDQVLSYK